MLQVRLLLAYQKMLRLHHKIPNVRSNELFDHRCLAQAPNMTGAIGTLGWNNGDTHGFSNGVFGQTRDSDCFLDPGRGAAAGICDYDLNASRLSSIYNGDKVQSPALQVLPCIRF